MTTPWYERGYRRMLVDMHISDWDAAQLAQFDPARMVELYAQAGLTSVMFYCQSHVGLCNWPTCSGKQHAGLQGRDIVAETLTLLQERRIDSCAYYSVVYNNWAFLNHPEWRMVPASQDTQYASGGFEGSRYGLCCPNNPDYRAFVLAQLDELLGPYHFDGFFYDMTFWPAICLCPHCRARFRAEQGAEIPDTIDWLDPAWCAFQAAREAWMVEFTDFLTRAAKERQPGITVYHNFACAAFNWTLGLAFNSAVHHDFLGADFYGDALEQILVSKLMGNLSEHKPIEFMTSRCVNLKDHEQVKSFAEMEMQALAAALFSAAFLFIDAINPDGTVNPAVYDRVGQIFRETAPLEPYLGGEQLEDIAIYFSNESRMDFRENGTPIGQSPMWNHDYPHLKAIRGACRALQQAHLPFGIITRKQLADLDRYRVIVLPNVLRMDQEEADALREYVRRGGKLYASRYTSLTSTEGTRHDDFLLADLFGCHFAADDLGEVTYMKPVDAAIMEAVIPQQYLGHYGQPGTPDAGIGMLRLAENAEGEPLATLTLPYAPAWGSVLEQNWLSIHSSPPWRDTTAPALLRHHYGAGTVIYSAADLECVGSEVNGRLFVQLLQTLLGSPSFSADTHPAVWMTVSHQPEQYRYLIGLLNYQAQLPAIPISRLPFTLRPPDGKQFIRLLTVPDNMPIAFTLDSQGALHAATELDRLQMLVAEYQ
ncbi:MAG TPA: alpha-amylase family protein [Armatimonadota bacterium]